ncbi:oligosaccharide flippase family protein [Cardiobacteriaceae bacterium TAE3-ERU3]|nr:oligosaccharide flippase family protein [Cardiobacteriaceae bacterium TAE3-ERU3]
MLVTLLVSGIVARALGVSSYGLFQYALSLSLIFMSLSYICGSEIIIPRLLRNISRRKQHDLLSNTFLLRLIAAISAYILLLLTAWYTEKSPLLLPIVSILGMMILCNEPFAVTTAWLQSRTFSKPKVLISITAMLVKIGFVLIIYYIFDRNILGFAIAWVSEFIFLAIGLSIYYKKNIYLGRPRFKFQLIRKLFYKGLPFFLALLIMQIFLRADMLMLEVLADDFALGIYASAMQLNLAVAAVAPLLVNTFAPKMVFSQKNISLIKRNVFYISGAIFGFSLLCLPILIYFSPMIVRIVFGESFAMSSKVFSYLLPGCCLYYLDCGLNIFFVKMGLGKLILLKWIFVLITALGLYKVLIPNYGVVGAALGYDIALLAAVIISLSFIFIKDNVLSVVSGERY